MKELLNLIPEEYFVKDLKENTLGTIKIALVREIIGNAIIRSNYPDETITLKIEDNKDVVEIPARKLKAPEKLLGLKLCREYNVIDKDFRYNVVKKKEQLANPNSVLFGDSVTESNEAVALTSRVIYDWAYSLRDVDEITSTLQHNALSEGGTMWNEDEGKLRQSLFQVQYVKPGAFFPHFVEVENVTPELFIHLLICITQQSRYFAQSTTNSPSNVKNHIIGVGLSKFEQPINSYLISRKWNNENISLETISQELETAMESLYGKANWIQGEKFTDLITNIVKDASKMKDIYNKAEKTAKTFLKDSKIIK